MVAIGVRFRIRFPHVMVEVASGGSSGVRQPCILQRPFGILILVFQLADVEVDLLGDGGVSMASFEPVEGDCERARLLTPIAIRVYDS